MNIIGESYWDGGDSAGVVWEGHGDEVFRRMTVYKCVNVTTENDH
jgi:hypothetical protein